MINFSSVELNRFIYSYNWSATRNLKNAFNLYVEMFYILNEFSDGFFFKLQLTFIILIEWMLDYEMWFIICMWDEKLSLKWNLLEGKFKSKSNEKSSRRKRKEIEGSVAVWELSVPNCCVTGGSIFVLKSLNENFLLNTNWLD